MNTWLFTIFYMNNIGKLRKHVLWSDNEKLKRWSDNTQSLLLPPDAFNTYMDLWDRPGWPKNHIFDHVDWKDWAVRTSIHYSWIPWILAEMSIHTHEYQSPLTIHTHDKATKCMSWIIHSNHEGAWFKKNMAKYMSQPDTKVHFWNPSTPSIRAEVIGW